MVPPLFIGSAASSHCIKFVAPVPFGKLVNKSYPDKYRLTGAAPPAIIGGLVRSLLA